ncbi:MAG: hypothetical protein U0350_41200 [Caldilineaceae bacterium]
MKLPRFAYFTPITLCALIISLFCATGDEIKAQPTTRLSAPARTEVHFVQDDSGTPIANQAVWVFCYDSPAPVDTGHLLSQQWVTTDSNGSPLTPLPATCTWVAALWRIHTQPSNKPDHGPAYWVFAASWPTGSGVPCVAAACTTILAQANGNVVIRQAWPLVLFNVVASLEWEPEPGSNYVNQLYQGLQSASLYLADLTDGYMAFGPVTIYTGGRHWEGADMRFQVANDRRPAAFVGGIVPKAITYTSGASTDPILPTITFRPATSFFGRYWSLASGAAFGAWDQPDGFRTLAHEWAHYALFLYDEYQGQHGETLQCVPPDLRSESPPTPDNGVASAMSWQYHSSEFWHPGDIATPPPTHPCYNTDQYRVHGESDWETLAKWFDIQQVANPAILRPLPIPSVTPEPDLSTLEQTVLGNLFGRSPEESMRIYLPLVGNAGGSTPAPTTTTIGVYTSDSPAVPPTQFSQVYILQAGATTPSHILYQGKPIGGSGALGYLGDISLLGVDEQADARILVDRYAYRTSSGASIAGGRFLYPKPGNVADLNAAKFVAAPEANDLSLDLIYGLSPDATGGPPNLTRITVVVTDPGKTTLVKPYAQLCAPDATLGCPAIWHKPMQQATDGSWYADFTPYPTMVEFPLYGVVRVHDELTQQDSLMRWFRDIGGIGPSPGHKTGAPSDDGADEPIMLRALDNKSLDGECNRVFIMPLAQYSALFAQSPPGSRLVSAPMDVDMLLGDTSVDKRGLPICTRSRSETTLVRLSMGYQQSEIKQLGIDEAHLQIFHYEPALGWSPVVSQTVQPPQAPGEAISATSLPGHNELLNAASIVTNTTDTDLKWVTITTTATSGVYAIGWMTQTNASALLERSQPVSTAGQDRSSLSPVDARRANQVAPR